MSKLRTPRRSRACDVQPRIACLGSIALLLCAPVAFANTPPTASAKASPSEATVNSQVSFDASASTDSDGPKPLSFSWAFGDGATSDKAIATHAYDKAGTFIATVTVSDGQATSTAQTPVVILPPISDKPRSSSSLVAINSTGDRLYTVNEDSGSISVVDTKSMTLVSEAKVCEKPRTIALSEDGARAYVTCRKSGELLELNSQTLEVTRQIPVGHLPFGVAVLPGRNACIVTNEGNASVTFVDLANFEVSGTVQVEADPRAIAIDSLRSRAYVTHYITRATVGQVTVIDLLDDTVEQVIPLVEDQSPDTLMTTGGFPNVLSTAAIDPSHQTLWVGGVKTNSNEGWLFNGALTPRNRVHGYLGPIDLVAGLENPTQRIDPAQADQVSAVVFSPNGRYAFVAHAGAGSVSVYDLLAPGTIDPTKGESRPYVARFDVSDYPAALAISPNGDRLYVLNVLAREVTVVDVAEPIAPFVLQSTRVTDEALEPTVALGKKMFFISRGPKHSLENYQSCGSCHPEAGNDGHTWDFSQFGEGLRNTIDLRGHAGTEMGPLHWTANFDEVQDFNNDIVKAFGGTGLIEGASSYTPLDVHKNAGRSAELDALSDYVTSLDEPPPAPPPSEATIAAIARGKVVFDDPNVGCAECHNGSYFTDSKLFDNPQDYVLHDVGTAKPTSGGRNFIWQNSHFDTPTLIGVWATPPYLHDGSAKTLRDVFTTANPADLHGRTSQLTSQEIDDLVAYVASIDEPAADITNPDKPPDPPTGESGSGESGCGCSSANQAPTAWSITIVFGLIVFASRRRCRIARPR